MNEGRENRKLGEFIEEYSERDKGKGYPVYSVTNSKGFCREFFGKNVASEDTSNYKVVPRGCFAYNPSRINVGSVACQNQEDFVSVSPLYVIFKVSQRLFQNYLLYYIKSKYCMNYINAYSRGSVRNNLKLSTLKTFGIPYVVFEEQQRIVAELDLLKSIIDKKKVQLKELDALAQSIFYDMFGDPIENPKGWEVKKMGEVCKKITDGSHNPPIGIDFSEYLMLSSKNVTYQGFTFDEPRYLTKEQFDVEHKRTMIQMGDVLLVIVGAGVGKCCVYKHRTPVTLQRSVAVLSPLNKLIDSEYLNRFLMTSHSVICNEAKGAAQKGIYLNQLSNICIPLPPLSLQQQFAEKIEVIETQKKRINDSIADTQRLFDYTMDKFFG